MTRILIVDDDPAQSKGLARAFSKLRPDLSVVTADNGLHATRLINERGVDLILTDLQMPEMDGFELLAWVHNHCPEVAVFTMSAFGTPDTALQLCGLGAVEYFAKPVDPKLVLGRLTDALNQSVRGHVQHVSLASLLQLLEMERKTCVLHVRCDEREGVLMLQKGQLVAARCEQQEGEAAAITIVAWPYPTITISRHLEAAASNIESSLGYIVMEAMRLQDEAARGAGADGLGSVWPVKRHTFRPSVAPSVHPRDSSRPKDAEQALPSGARGLAVVETATGNILFSSASHDCPLGELARMAAHLLLQEAETLSLCAQSEGVEELVLSTTSRCDVIRPLGSSHFAMLVFAPEETNLVMARLELDRFLATRGR